MLLCIPDVLNAAQVAQCREALQKAPWVDGRVTSGPDLADIKNNMQVPEDHPVSRQLGGMIIDGLSRNRQFMVAALPLRVLPPKFNRYEGGQSYGAHVDNTVFKIHGTPHSVRTDLSATLFLSKPEEYDGGELVVEDTFGVHRVKLPEGHMVLYPSGSVHHVAPVTRGTRIASFFWIQSMVRDDGERTLLWDLDKAIQSIGAANKPAVTQLTSVYHNLLRRWADV